MRTASLIFVLAAIPAKGQGSLQINNIPYNTFFVKGKSYNITYTPADDAKTTFQLVRGPPQNIATVATLSTTAVRGVFDWTPQDSLSSGDNYGIQISRDNFVAYSPQFSITDENPSTSTIPLSLWTTSISSTFSSVTFSRSPISSSTGGATASEPTAGLSTGEIAGIGVGAAIAGLTLGIAAFFISRVFRRRAKPSTAASESWAISGKPELDSKSLYPFEAAREMDANLEVQELHGHDIPGEVEANHPPCQSPAPQELHAHARPDKTES